MDLMETVPEEVRITGVQQTKDRLGMGAFGVVFLAHWHGAEVAVKRLHPLWLRTTTGGKSTAFCHFISECRRLARMHHPNIVQEMGVCEPTATYESPGLVTERLACTLRDRCAPAVQPPLGDSGELRVGICVAAGLQHLHSMGIVHRDLTTNNVLLSSWSPDEFVAKIGDIGCAKLMEHGDQIQGMTAEVGNRSYLGPEALGFSVKNRVVSNERSADEKVWYGPPIDIYACGVLLLAMAVHREPPEFAKLILEGRDDDLADLRADHPLAKAIDKCLKVKPQDRGTAEELVSDFRAIQKSLAKARGKALDQCPKESLGASDTACTCRLSSVAAAQATSADKDAEMSRLQEHMDSTSQELRQRDEEIGRLRSQLTDQQQVMQKLQGDLLSESTRRQQVLEEQAAGFPELTMVSRCALFLGPRPGHLSPSAVATWRTIGCLPKKSRISNMHLWPCVHHSRLFIAACLKYTFVTAWKLYSSPLQNVGMEASWVEIQPPPQCSTEDSNARFSLCSAGEHLVCVYSFRNNPPKVWMKREDGQAWTHVADFPGSRSDFAVGSVPGCLFLAGGTVEDNGQASLSTDVFSLDLLSGSRHWNKWPSLPTGCSASQIKADSDTVYILCHKLSSEAQRPVILSASLTAPLEERRWVLATFRSPPFAGCSLALCNSRLIVFGGTNAEQEAQGGGFIYSPVAKTWLPLPEHPHRPCTGSVIAMDKLLLNVGGTFPPHPDVVNTAISLLKW